MTDEIAEAVRLINKLPSDEEIFLHSGQPDYIQCGHECFFITTDQLKAVTGELVRVRSALEEIHDEVGKFCGASAADCAQNLCECEALTLFTDAALTPRSSR